MGTRLAAINPGRPKALYEVDGRRLFDYACDFAEHVSERRIVVGGFGYDELRELIATTGRRSLRLVCTSDYRHGNIMSVLAALPHFEGDVLVMNVDHVYCPEVCEVVTAARDEITIFCDGTRSLAADDMKVALSRGEKVRRISKHLDSYETGYVGMTYIPRTSIHRYTRAVTDTIAVEGDRASAESAIQTLVADGADVYAYDLGGLWWAEVDTPADAVHLAQAIHLATRRAD